MISRPNSLLLTQWILYVICKYICNQKWEVLYIISCWAPPAKLWRDSWDCLSYKYKNIILIHHTICHTNTHVLVYLKALCLFKHLQKLSWSWLIAAEKFTGKTTMKINKLNIKCHITNVYTTIIRFLQYNDIFMV